MQACLGYRRKKQVRARHAPEHLATRPSSDAGYEERGRGPIDRPSPTAGNFVLADVGESGTKVYEKLLRHGVIVRPVAGYGLPRCVRITLGTAAQNEKLIHALASATKE